MAKTVNQLATKEDLRQQLTQLEERLEMHIIYKLATINVVVVGLFTGILGCFIKLIH